MSDNYEEETQPLFRHLRTEAFRFIIVRFNHYDLFRRLEADLRKRFPERDFGKINAEKATFQSISEAYYAQKNGFFWIENFDFILRETDTRFAENQEQVLAEKERRHRITAGMNLRRDTFAKTPIALFVFVRADQELYARMIMDKMPDLWSFRSLMLDLEMEIQVQGNQNTLIQGIETSKIQILEKEEYAKKLAELENLQSQLIHTAADEIAYRLTLYPQIADLQTELGKYEAALISLEEWEQIDPEKALIWFKKGDIYEILGKITEAQNAFEQALSLYQNQDNKNNIAVSYERLGSIYTSLGDLDKALDFYEKDAKLTKELYEAYPSNVGFKNGLAISYEKLGKTYSEMGNLDKALAFFETETKLFEELYEAYPSNVAFKNGLAISYSKLGETQSKLGNLEKALEFFEKRNQLGKELYEAYPSNVAFKNGLAISYEKLGKTYSEMGNLDKALEFFEKRNQLGKELYEAYSSNVSFKRGLAISYQYLGNMLSAKGELEKALENYLKQNNLMQELYEAYPNNVSFKNGLAISYSKLGDTYSEKGNLEKSLAFFEKRNQLGKELYEAYPSNVDFKNGLAISYSKLGDFYRNSDKEKAKMYYLESQKLLAELVQHFPAYVEFQHNLRWVENQLREISESGF